MHAFYYHHLLYLNTQYVFSFFIFVSVSSTPRLVLDFDLLVYVFGQFPLVVCTWLCMCLSAALVPFMLLQAWAQSQCGSSSHPGLWSLLYGSAFLLYQAVGLGFLPTYVAVSHSLPPASSFIVILEQVALTWRRRGPLMLAIKMQWGPDLTPFGGSCVCQLTRLVSLSMCVDSRCVSWWKLTPLCGRTSPECSPAPRRRTVGPLLTGKTLSAVARYLHSNLLSCALCLWYRFRPVGPTAQTVSVFPFCAYSHLQRQVPQVKPASSSRSAAVYWFHCLHS